MFQVPATEELCDVGVVEEEGSRLIKSRHYRIRTVSGRGCDITREGRCNMIDLGG